MLKMINIDECYLALISRYTGYESKTNNMVLINSYKVKFTIVKYIGAGYYKDIISNEKYKTGADEGNFVGDLFINEDYYLLPLNTLLKVDSKFIGKKKLLELVKQAIIELTSYLYTEEIEKINSIETIRNLFNEVKIKKRK